MLLVLRHVKKTHNCYVIRLICNNIVYCVTMLCNDLSHTDDKEQYNQGPGS